ncbi:MAG: DUF1565 domain-containing protein, partial [Pseudomonadota bacterium]
QATISNNTVIGASGVGIALNKTAATGTFDNILIDNNFSTGNGASGLQINTTSGAINARIQNNVLTGNGFQGIFVNDDFATGSINVDLGGGALGSVGNNSIFNNTGAELTIDLDGDTLSAENNWWGSATGLDPSDVTLIDSSAIDADPFLTSSP